LYFVASGEGGHIFTKDFDAHKRAIQQYRKTREEQRAMKEFNELKPIP